EWVHVQLHQQKGMISLSPPTICNSAWYFNVGYSAPIADTGFTGLASVGYNKLKNKDSLLVVAGGPGEDDSYIDYKVGVNYNILGIVAELDVVGTDISTSGMTDAQKKPYDTGLVFSLTKTF
ncbi:TorF family putative porin, partial [Acinetobacter baumannii]|uniref:TorF family putative porin n=1 Tax=Acinetobacter baumannii TaxID=470 RepID=UPI003B840011